MRVMSDGSETADSLTAAAPRREADHWRLVQLAPQPEQPTSRDKRGAQTGMLIALGAGALFWGAVAAGVALLLN